MAERFIEDKSSAARAAKAAAAKAGAAKAGAAKAAAAAENDITAEKLKTNSLPGDMVILFLITFASSAFMYEKYLPDAAAAAVSITVSVICGLSWAFISFYNGVMRRWLYGVYPAFFWLVPQLIIFLADSGPRMFRMSVIMYVLSEFSTLITMRNGEFFGSLFHMSASGGAVLIMIVSYICFGVGAYISREDKK